MKLLFERVQTMIDDKLTFVLRCTTTLTAEEQQWHDRYGTLDFLYPFAGGKDYGNAGDPRLNDLLFGGREYLHEDARECVKVEKQIVAACEQLDRYWRGAASYTGNETVTIPPEYDSFGQPITANYPTF